MTTTKSLPSGFSALRFQQEYAVDMAVSAFKAGAQAVVVDAPPGTGKTLLGEVTRRELDVPGIYLCKSHQLQEQAARDFPHAVLLKGRANYPTEKDPTVTADNCNYRKKHPCDYCFSKKSCPYELVKEDGLSAELCIQNLAYFFTECNGPGRFANSPLVILDECDLLEETILHHIELNYTGRTLMRLGLDHIKWPKQKSAGVTGKGKTEHLVWLNNVSYAAEGMAEKLEFKLDRNPGDDAAARKLKDLMDFARKARRAEVGIEEGTWFYDNESSRFHGPSIRFAPILVEQLGEGFFFNHGQRWLCMSGTVGNGREWLREVGFTGHAEIIECPSPFPPSSREVRFAPVGSLSRDTAPEMWPRTARAVRAIQGLHPGSRVLVQTMSYKHAQAIEAELKDPLVMAQPQGKKDGKLAIQWYEETEGAVLCSPVLSRGYDGADEKVRVIVVAKMPYPNFGDERVAQRVYRSPHGRREGQLWLEAQVARQLMQMTSRGTRHETDWSVSYIIDGRFYDFWKGAQDQLSAWWKEALVWNGPWREVIEAAA